MSQNASPLKIQLVGPRTWDAACNAAWQATSARMRRLAAATPTGNEPASSGATLRQTAISIMLTSHNRHIGMPPEIAYDLAALLLPPHAQDRLGRPWQAILARLRRELWRPLHQSQGSAAPASISGGLRLQDAPTYTVLRLAIPLVALACGRVGRSVLACGDEPEQQLSAADFAAYQSQIAAAIEAITMSDETAPTDDPYASFWAELALTYTGRTSRPTAERASPALPEVDPVSLAWFLRLVPDPKPRLKDVDRPRIVTTPLKRQRSRLLNQDGVRGYKLTQRLEDLGSIVHTELLNPDLLLLDRILNTGYLTVERPPRYQKRRDVLVIGMLPPSMAAHPLADMLKAAWFDCMWRFSSFLRGQQLLRSEIRWIESERADRAHSSSFLLEDLPGLEQEHVLTPGDHWMFLKTLRWVPAFLNQRARPALLDRVGTQSLAAAPEVPWCRAALAIQHDNPHFDQTTSQRTRRWKETVEEFAHVHLMILLPSPIHQDRLEARARDNPQLQAWHRLRQHLGTELPANMYMTTTWSPAQSPEHAWMYITAGRVLELQPASSAPKHIAASIEQAWLDQLIEDTCRE